MTCCLCGNEAAASVMDCNGRRIVRCPCGMVRTDNFAEHSLSYAGDGYFVERNRYIAQWEVFAGIFDSLMAKIEPYKSTGRMLDVGAGVGTLVAAAMKRGFDASGVEISEWASAFARNEKGLDVATGSLETARFSDEEFDLVTINHVLEHIADPVAVLKEIRRILKPDGLLVIGVPNIGSIMAGIKGARWASLRPDEHIWHFTPDTLRRITVMAGFGELFFESRDNHVPQGWGIKAGVIRMINRVAVICGRSEAMLLFCEKA